MTLSPVERVTVKSLPLTVCREQTQIRGVIQTAIIEISGLNISDLGIVFSQSNLRTGTNCSVIKDEY